MRFHPPASRCACGRFGTVLALALLGSGAGLALSLQPASAGPNAAFLAASAGSPARSAAGRKGAPPPGLPDTVLARVGTNRSITASKFRGAWAQVRPPARPDSLTPESGKEFLDLLVGKEVLGQYALSQNFAWTARESIEVKGLRDQLVLKVALDSSLAETKRALAASGHPTANPESLGTAARDSLVTRLDTRFVDARLAIMAERFRALPRPSRDSSVSSQLRVLGAVPHVDSSEVREPLARCRSGDFTVGDLIASWQRLNPLYRPRVETAAQVADLVRNGIYERELRARAANRDVAHWPQVAATVARKEEFIAVEHLVAREVYAKIAMDSTTLERYYHSDAGFWDLPLRASVIVLRMGDRGSASQMALRLRNAADAESLAAAARRSGLNYHEEWSAGTDSALFARVVSAGTGTVLGPDSTEGGWRVLRVSEMLPPRGRSYDEVKALVAQRWYSVEGERLMVDLIERLKRDTPVTTNPHALAILVREGAGPSKPRAAP